MPPKKSKKKVKNANANQAQTGSQPRESSSHSLGSSGGEINNDSGVLNEETNVGTGSQDGSSIPTDSKIEIPETVTLPEPVTDSPKADQVLDTKANSPFGSPTGNATVQIAEKPGSPQAADLVLSPMTEPGAALSPKAEAVVEKTSSQVESPKSAKAQSPTAKPAEQEREASPVVSPKAAEQTAAVPEETPAEVEKLATPVASPKVASPTAAEKLPTPDSSPKVLSPSPESPKGEPSESPKVSVEVPVVPTPKVVDVPAVLSPAPVQLSSPTKEVTAIRESPIPSVVITELPVEASDVAPQASVRSVKREDDLLRQSVDLAAMLPPPTPGGYPNLPSGRPTPSGSVYLPTVSVDAVSAPSPAKSVHIPSPMVQNIPESPAKFPNITSFVTGGSIALESAPAEPTPTSPARHAEAAPYQSPPRATALDSIALQESSQVWHSIAESAPKASTVNPSGPITLAAHSMDVRGDTKLIYSPITFEEAMLQLTGSTGKSWRMADVSAVPEKAAGGFAKVCQACFGSRGVKLMKELEQDKEIQNMLFNTPFNADVDAHRQMLATVYVYFTGDEKPNLPMVGDHWTRIGFRTSDPAVELNANGGVFTLVCILYFIDEFGIDAQATFRECNVMNFATAAIAAAGMAFAVAQKGKLNAKYNSQRQVVGVTCRLFVALMKQLPSIWNQATFSQDELERVKKTAAKGIESDEGLSKALDSVPAPHAVTASSAK